MCVVASLAEAWIEIEVAGRSDKGTASPPSRRRGLKSVFVGLMDSISNVASLAEAWIEIVNSIGSDHCSSGRLPRGGVD